MGAPSLPAHALLAWCLTSAAMSISGGLPCPEILIEHQQFFQAATLTIIFQSSCCSIVLFMASKTSFELLLRSAQRRHGLIYGSPSITSFSLSFRFLLIFLVKYFREKQRGADYLIVAVCRAKRRVLRSLPVIFASMSLHHLP